MSTIRFNARVALAAALWFGVAQAALADPVTDFFRAVQIDNAGAVKSLSGAAVDPNMADPISGETALILAMREDSMNVFKVLLADPRVKLELAAPNGNTALMMAAFKRNMPAVQALLAKGAAVNRPGWTPLHYAGAGGDAEIVRVLLAHKADVNAPSPGKLTPLMLAAREGQESSVQALLDAGADTSLKNNEGLTAAQIAERADKPRIANAIETHRTAPKP